MKGVIFNIAEEFITDKWGEATYEEIISNLPIQTKEPYVGPGTYPDQDFFVIVSKAAEITHSNINDFLKDFGYFSFFKLVELAPQFIKTYSHPKPFLMSVEGIIHVEVRKLYMDTYLPTFTYRDTSADTLIITYYSKRKLYAFMEGLIDGTAAYFKVPIKQKHTIYTKDGKEYCDFELTF